MASKPVTVVVFENEPIRFQMLVQNIRKTMPANQVVFRWSRDGREVSDEHEKNIRLLVDNDLVEGQAGLIVVDLKMDPETKEYGKFGGLVILQRIFSIPNHCRSIVANTVHNQQIETEAPAVKAAITRLQNEEELIVIDTNAERARDATLLRQVIASRGGRRLLSPQVERQILFLGRMNEPVLILGEAGSGKEGIASSIHQAWREHMHGGQERPFTAINAGALRYDMMRAELFGYAPHAFTGAQEDGAVGAALTACGIRDWAEVQGKARLPDDRQFHGTLFIDEIGNMSEDCQGVLLRFLEKPYAASPLGHPEIHNVMPRVIAATNDPRWCELARTGYVGDGVRTDLFDRLSRHIIYVPRLTASDVAGFVEMVREQRWEKEAVSQVASLVGNGAIRGNVRGLVNFIKRTEALVGLGDDIGWRFDSVIRETVDLSLRLSRIPAALPERRDPDQPPTFRTPKGNEATSEQMDAAIRYAVACEDGGASRTKDAPGSLLAKYGETTAELILLMWFVAYSKDRNPREQKLEEFRNVGAMRWFASTSDRLANRSVQETAKAVLGLRSMKEIIARAAALQSFCVANGRWPRQMS